MPTQQMAVIVTADLEDPEDWRRLAVELEKAARIVEANASIFVPLVPGEEWETTMKRNEETGDGADGR